MFSNAKETLQRKFRNAPLNEATRERLAKEHGDTLKNIRRIADDLYQDKIEQ